MSKKLIELSKEKGFISRDNLIEPSLNYAYLWMCEVQQWLRERHEIIIVILPFLLEDGGITYEYTNYSTKVEEELDHGDGPFDTYEIALEAALVSALNLL
jgi:hypothetical protein